MPRVRISILLRLTLWNASVLALLLVAFAAAGLFTIERVVHQRAATVVRESARAVAGAIMAERRAATARGEVELVRGEHERAVLRELRVGDLDIFITDEAEQLMAAREPADLAADVADADQRQRTRVNATGNVELPTAVRTLLTDVRDARDAGRLADSSVVVRQITLAEGSARAAVLRVEPEANDEAEPALLIAALRSERDDLLLLSQVRTTIYFAIPMALLVSVIAGYLLARRSLAPLDAIITRTSSITAASLDDRLPVVNPHDELGRLAQIINGLLGRVGDAFRTQRQFVADASHELRTPIAIIRGEADVTLRRAERSPQEYREALGVIHDESLRLSRIVDDLFLLARVDAAGHAVRRDVVHMHELVADAGRSVRTLAESREVVVTVTTDVQATVRGDAVLLRRLLLNLLDNALKHAPRGSTVELSLAQSADTVRVRVADEGPGVAAEQRDRIFERFVHGVNSAVPNANHAHGTGAGLGLAIAQAIAHAHEGEIVLLDRASGATFDVVLPLVTIPGEAE